MADKPIQQQFGEKVIQAFADFARSDLKTPGELEKDEFSHVSEVPLRRSLSQVLYGVRWIYKLGLALLTHDEERAAHVRAQIVDYASVAEGLLSHCVAHAIRRGHTVGTSYRWADPDRQQKPINWTPPSVEGSMRRQTLWWLIRVSDDFGIVDGPLAKDLQWLREQRNDVHLRQRASLGHTAFLHQSKKAFTITMRVVRQTKSWKGSHP